MPYTNRDGRPGYCWCGCGEQPPLATYTRPEKGIFKGQPRRFIRNHHVKKVQYLEQDMGYSSPCWVWQMKIGNNGYGHISVGGRDRLAHRYYYELHKEPIPAGLSIDHLCRVRHCVNPDHLEAVPMHINQRRGGRTILNEELVEALREAHRCGVLLPTLEVLTGIKRRTLRAAIHGENWTK